MKGKGRREGQASPGRSQSVNVQSSNKPVPGLLAVQLTEQGPWREGALSPEKHTCGLRLFLG